MSRIATPLLAWWDAHGRRDLPWQHPRSPYRVWVSEIMLQQTQVAVVIPYFERFMARFPDAPSLAEAPLDEVLHLWTGLGYYARARNLHAAARDLVARFNGAFPGTREELESLPGIGRSTAAAILAQAHGIPEAILDGNVKRVLARYHAVPGWPGRTAVQRTLWTHAEAHTPQQRVADYTQAIMDLGATVCTRRRPRCADCPLAADCAARAADTPDAFPEPKPKKAMPVRATCMLLLTAADGSVLLEQRPASGLWGGLWSLPETTPDADLHAAVEGLLPGARLAGHTTWSPLRHTFSHYHLDITPVQVNLARDGGSVADAPHLWYNPAQPARVGLAAPVQRLLAGLDNNQRDAS